MKFMICKSIKNLSILCAVIIGLTGCDQFSLSQSKVVYIDIEKVIKDSPLSKQEEKRNQEVKSVLVNADASAKEKYKEMTSEQQQKSSAADAMILNQVWVAEQQHTREMTILAIKEEAESYRAEHNLNYVINSALLFSSEKKNDVTQEIIKRLGSKTINYGELPKISVSESAKDSEKQE